MKREGLNPQSVGAINFEKRASASVYLALALASIRVGPVPNAMRSKAANAICHVIRHVGTIPLPPLKQRT